MQDCGINITEVNPDYISFNREVSRKFFDDSNFVECICPQRLREDLLTALERHRAFGPPKWVPEEYGKLLL